MRQVFRQLDSWAVWLCVLAMGLGMLGERGTSIRSSQLETTRDRIRLAMASIPDQLGEHDPWIKVADHEVPPTQADMLGLNAYVSRVYQRLGAGSVRRATLFIANSADARSMAGHHPPNCYPASGWEYDADAVLSCFLPAISGHWLPVRIYRFVGGREGGIRLWVVSGFLMPDGRAVATLEETAEIAARAATSRLGLTQFQILFQDDLPAADVERYAGEILRGLPEELFLAVGGTVDAAGAAGDGGGS